MMGPEPFSTRPVRRFRLGPGGAFLISLGFHLALLSWLQFAAPAGLLLEPVREAALTSSTRQPRSPAAVPLRFTFVDVPDDEAVPESPNARLLSDKTRMARQPVPTPPDVKDLGPDPHAVGNSRQRQISRPGPTLPSSPPPRPPSGTARRQPPSGQADTPTGEDRTWEGWEGKAGRSDPVEGEGGEEDFRAERRREAFRKALQQLESGTYDFSSFDNPSYLQGGNYGTLSFDTKGFDWGDYARQIYLIIKKNWYDRIPIAAWYGQKGKVFIRFSIEKDGSITDLAVIRSSDISPFDRAAENAIRASHPLLPLPSNFPREREGVTFGFYYNLPIDAP